MHGDGQFWDYFYHGERQLVQNAWLIIDKRGQRVPFYSTLAQPAYQQWPITQMGDLSNFAASTSRIGHRVYPIFDADYPTNVFKICQTVVNDKSCTPLVSTDKLLPQTLVSTDWQKEVDAAVARDALVQADTIEELATKLGISPPWHALRWTGGTSSARRGPTPTWSCRTTRAGCFPSKAPYYSCVMSFQIGKTACGLRVDENLQVLSTEGDLILGLYANFTTAGGICGESSYCSQWNFSITGSQALSWVSGYLAAKSLMASGA